MTELVLIVDTETTGLNPEEGFCIELGAILFSVRHRRTVAQVSVLMPCFENPAEPINGISAALSRVADTALVDAGIAAFNRMLEQADVLLAHNAEFDSKWFGVGALPPVHKPWVCSMSDIPWPKELGLKGRPSVTALALAHGVPVWAAHRALTDCIYLAQVLERRNDLEELLEAAMQPRQWYAALVSYDDRQLAKDAGFSWDGQRKLWLRRMSEAETAALGFKVRAVEAGGKQ